jgi:uncharacterized membrane protein
MTRFRFVHHLKSTMWFVPVLFVLGGVVASVLCTSLDDDHLVPQSVTGDPNAVLQILYLIAFSMLTLTGLVLSLVVVMVQLAMGVFSPRIVRQILHDRPSQCAIGLFAGTFAFALLAMRDVHTIGHRSVPGVALIGAVVLVLACIGTLLWYINHIGQSLRVAALAEWVADDALSTLDRVCPIDGDAPEEDDDVVALPGGGVVFEMNHDRLVTLAEKTGCVLEMQAAIGDFVPTDAPLARIRCDATNTALALADIRKGILRYVAVGPERTLNQDLAYGIRLLVDIAERSLAGGPFGDPTTAVQAIDRIHNLLRQLARRPLPSGRYDDAHGVVRLIVPTVGWDGYVRLGFDEIRQAGSSSPQVSRRLKDALEDLMTVVPVERRAALERQLRLLEGHADVPGRAEEERHDSLVGDRLGLGSGSDLLIGAPRAE